MLEWANFLEKTVHPLTESHGRASGEVSGESGAAKAEVKWDVSKQKSSPGVSARGEEGTEGSHSDRAS